MTVIAGCSAQARPTSRKNLPNTEFNISLASNNVTAIIFIPEIGPVLRSFNSCSDCLILSFKLKGRQTATNNQIVSAVFFSPILQYDTVLLQTLGHPVHLKISRLNRVQLTGRILISEGEFLSRQQNHLSTSSRGLCQLFFRKLISLISTIPLYFQHSSL